MSTDRTDTTGPRPMIMSDGTVIIRIIMMMTMMTQISLFIGESAPSHG